MKSHRILSIFLIVVLGLSAFTACGKQPADSQADGSNQPSVPSEVTNDKVELTYCYWGAESEAKVRKQVAQMYTDSQDKVSIKPIFIDAGSYYAKLQAYFAANNAPDVIQSSGNFADTYTGKGMIEDLAPMIEKDNLKDKWDSLLLDTYTFDGKIYAVPMIYNTFYIIYNKSLFDKAGVPYPKNDWTEEEFFDAAQKLTSGEGTDKQYGIRLSWLPGTLLPDLYGQHIFDVPNKKLNAANNQAFIDGFTYFTDLALKYKVAPDAAGEKAAGSGFVSGKYAMELSAMWDMDQIMKTVGDSFEFDIVKFPINAEYGRWRTPIANIGFYISSQSKHKEEAWDFVKFGSTDESAQNEMNLAGIPALSSITSSDAFQTTFPEGWKPVDRNVVKDLDDAVLWPSDTGVWGKIMTEITTQYDLVMNQKSTVEEAVNNLQKAGDTILSKEG